MAGLPRYHRGRPLRIGRESIVSELDAEWRAEVTGSGLTRNVPQSRQRWRNFFSANACAASRLGSSVREKFPRLTSSPPMENGSVATRWRMTQSDTN